MRAFSIVFNLLREADKDMKYLENLIFLIGFKSWQTTKVLGILTKATSHVAKCSLPFICGNVPKYNVYCKTGLYSTNALIKKMSNLSFFITILMLKKYEHFGLLTNQYLQWC